MLRVTSEVINNMTLLEVIDLSREFLKDELPATRAFPDDSSTYFKDTSLIRFYNAEQKRLQNKLVQSFENYFVTSTLTSVVSDTEEYSIPSGTIKIVRIENVETTNNPIPLTPISFNEKDTVSYDGRFVTNHTYTPTYYAIKGNSLILRPIPSKNITNGLKIYFSKRVSDITSASSVSVIPPEYHELLSIGVAVRGMQKQEASTESIAVLDKHYRELFNEMTLSAEDRQVQKSRTVRRVRGRIR